jgi:hypothetical protein
MGVSLESKARVLREPRIRWIVTNLRVVSIGGPAVRRRYRRDETGAQLIEEMTKSDETFDL